MGYPQSGYPQGYPQYPVPGYPPQVGYGRRKKSRVKRETTYDAHWGIHRIMSTGKQTYINVTCRIRTVTGNLVDSIETDL